MSMIKSIELTTLKCSGLEKRNNRYMNTLTNGSDQVFSPHHESLFLFKKSMVNMEQDEILTLDKHIPTHRRLQPK